MKKIASFLSIILSIILIDGNAQGPSNFVPNQLLVKIKNTVALAPEGISKNISLDSELLSIKSSLQSFSLKAIDRPYIEAKNFPALQNIYLIKLNKPEQLEAMIEILKKDPSVEYVEKDYIIKAIEHVPNDPNYGNSSHLNRVSAPNAWEIKKGKSLGVKVAILDSGVDFGHPDLAANLDYANSYDFIANDNNANPDDFTNEVHGTHVAGIVGAVTNNGVGVSSLSYGVNMIIGRVLDSNGSGPSSGVASAIIWATNQGANIINMSLGGGGYFSPLDNACQYAVNAGVVVVASAGNDGVNSIGYPAAYPNVFSVGSTTSTDLISSFSNYGTDLDICAPGSSIYSTYPSNQYRYLSGTSMAAPLVASLFALLKAANPTFTRVDLEYRVRQSADNIDYRNPSYVGQLGAGRINAASTLNLGYNCINNLGAYNASSLLGLGNITFNSVLQNGTNSSSRDGKYTYNPTATPTSLNLGTNTFETVQFRGSYTNIVVGFWLDYNSNGIFDTSEKIYQGSPISATSTTFNVPCNTPTGTYRLRVRITDSQANIDACNFYAMGDTKDYMVLVQAQDAQAMTASISQTGPICAGTNITLNFNGCTNGTMAWQDNASNVSPRVVAPIQTTIYKAECTKDGCVVDTKVIPVILPPKGTQNSIIQWEKSFGGTAEDGFSDIVKTSDGGYLVSGNSFSSFNGNRDQGSRGNDDGVLIKLDANGNKVWEKVFGGTQRDYIVRMIPTNENNYLLLMTSGSGIGFEKTSLNKGGLDNWIIKITPNGDIIWQVSMGSDLNEYIQDAELTPDGGYIIGTVITPLSPATGAPNGDRTQALKSNDADYWVLKLDANGVKVWDRVYGGTATESMWTMEKALDNSGYFLTGYTSSASGANSDITTSARHDYDGWLLKIDENGNKLFDKTYSGGLARSDHGVVNYSYEFITHIKPLPDGNYLLAINSNNHAGFEKSENSMGGMDVWLVKISPNGTKISDKVIGGPGFNGIGDMIVLSDGSVILCSTSIPGSTIDKIDAVKGVNDAWVTKLDPNLNIMYSKSFGGSVVFDQNQSEILYKVINDGNDNFVFAGYANESKGDRIDAFGQNDGWVMKLNIPSIIKPTISSNTTLYCSGESITLTVNGCTSNILWSNGATTNSVVVKPNSNDNTYKVNCLTNANACIGLDSDLFRVNLAPSDLNLSGTAISGVKQAKGTIISKEIINNGINVNYKAGKSILLDKNQSFEAKAGSVFKAEIATGCNIEQGLTGYYPFNNNVQDASGSNRHGVLSGALFTKDRFGKSNAALSFDGIDDGVTLQYDYLGYQELTISAWINVKDLANGGQTILIGSGPIFILSQQSNAGFGINTSTTEGGTATGQVLILSNLPNNPKNTWAHILVKFKSGDSKYYLNGQIVGSNTQAYNFIRYSGVLRIGIQNSFGTLANPFKGEIDDLRIYNRALSDAEVVALYKSEAPNPSLSTGLFANFKFDGNANDVSGKGNNGSIIGGATFTTDRFGQANKALNFDGVDDYFRVINNNTLSGFNEVTLSAWINHNQPTSTLGAIIAKWYQLTGQDTYAMSILGGSNKLLGNTNLSNVISFESSTSIPINTWSFITFTHNADGDKLYINNELVASNSIVGNIIYSPQDLLIGADNNLGAIWRFFKGALDDVKLYNRALSPLEVLQLYDLEKP